ncbi:hypothetical protein V1L52_09930 [Treponema sp. HNW]|uniref:InlB B-repeat-containing protein n=1 Tax=Treponema sp. HNW TaxID=3116654 RepID=UPI003D09F8FC
MKNSNTNKSAKRFTHWAAITVLAASLVIMGLFTACPNAAGGGGTTPLTKYKVTLEPASDGTVTVNPALPSDGMVAENTEITFTAFPHAGYKLQKWELNGQTVNGTSPTYKLKVTQNAQVKVSFELLSGTPSVYLAGTIGTIGNEKPHYWKNGTKYELEIDAGKKGAAYALTLKDGTLYSAGEQKGASSRARVWKEDTLYWGGSMQWLGAKAILTDGTSLYMAGKLNKGGKVEAAIANITDTATVRSAHLHTSAAGEKGSEAYGLCASPSAFYAVGTIANNNSSQNKAALWTISKTLDGTVTETKLDTGSSVKPKAVCLLDGAVYAAGKKAADKVVVWKVTGTGAGVTPAELGTGSFSEANAACTKDGLVFIGGKNGSSKPCIWKGTDGSFIATELSTKAGTVNALYVFGTDIYAAGYAIEGGIQKAAYWKFTSGITPDSDAVETVIPDNNAEALGIVVTME